jgi:hypothetical protein
MVHDSPGRRVSGETGFLAWPPAPRRTEKKLWSAFRAGQQMDLRPNGTSGGNGSGGNGSGGRGRRVTTRGAAVRAKAIVAILRAEPRRGHNSRLTLCGARITGSLDLSHARIEHPIVLRDCVFDEPIVLAEARLGALTLDGSSFPGIDGQNLEVEGDLGLSGVSSSRMVQLTGAHLRCSLRLDGATITADAGQKVAVCGDGMTVGQDVNAQRLTTVGEVRLVDVTIDSTLEFRGATLANPGGVALRLDRAEISSSLYCDNGFTAVGEVCAIGAHVKGSVYLNKAELGTPTSPPGVVAPTGVALRVVRTTVDGDFGGWEGFVSHGTLDLARSSVAGEFRLRTTELMGYPRAADLTNCQVGTLQLSGDPPPGFLDFTKATADFFKDSAAYWQGGDVILDGFEYRSIQMNWVTVKQREQWLGRAMETSRRKPGGDHDGYVPQPYEQLAAAYRRAGDDRAAQKIQLAKYRQRNRVIGWRRWYSKLWNIIQDVVIGYGYQPLRAFLWLIGLLVAGIVLFRYVSTPYSITSGHRTFTLSDSVGYTIDLLLPTSALQERQVWQSSDGLGEVAAASLVVFGYLLTATVFAAFARVLQRD